VQATSDCQSEPELCGGEESLRKTDPSLVLRVTTGLSSAMVCAIQARFSLMTSIAVPFPGHVGCENADSVEKSQGKSEKDLGDDIRWRERPQG
jgi:hypothetical protein